LLHKKEFSCKYTILSLKNKLSFCKKAKIYRYFCFFTKNRADNITVGATLVVALNAWRIRATTRVAPTWKIFFLYGKEIVVPLSRGVF
jgi:hypothetical protein